LAVRQDGGGSRSIALAFINDARLVIPVGPRNLSSYGGSLLRPLLLSALYLYLSILVSSSVEMWWSDGVVRGVYVSGMMSSSWNICLLKFVNLSRFTSTGLVSCCLIMFQNNLGLYLSMSGSSSYSWAR
jgi:hypothetical protein